MFDCRENANNRFLTNLYFMSFIMISTFIMLNLFIMIIIEYFENFNLKEDNPLEKFNYNVE